MRPSWISLLPLLLTLTLAMPVLGDDSLILTPTTSPDTSSLMLPPVAPVAPVKKSFSLDDWQSQMLPPETPTRERLYKGDDGNAPIQFAKPPAPPVAIAPGHLPAKTSPAKAKSDDDRLAAIAVEDRDLFQALAQNPNQWTETERDRRAQVIHDHYMQYIIDYPNDVNAVILYGKLLGHVGQNDLAYQVFRHANELDANIAVVKQQLANHLAETGEYSAALDLLRKAVAISPSEPIYHYEIGELLNIYYEKFVADKVFDTVALDKNIESEFARAMALAPNVKGYAWRHAECYYDQHTPDWKAALAAWDALAAHTMDQTEIEVIQLHRARDLLELNRPEEARPLLSSPVRVALEASRQALLKRLPPAPTPPARFLIGLAPGNRLTLR